MQKTLKTANTTGYVLDLGEVVTSIRITATTECWVKPAYADTVPDSSAAPGSGVIPASAGDITDYIHLNTGAFTLQLSAADGQLSKTADKPVRWNHVLVRSVAAGEVLAAGV